MLLHIVYAVTADKLGPDLTRIGRVEEIDDDLARVMLSTGEARRPTEDEVADWQATREATAAAEAGDLTRLTKAELLELAADRGVEVPPHATKAWVADAIQEHDETTPDVVDVPLPDDAGAEDVPEPDQS